MKKIIACVFAAFSCAVFAQDWKPMRPIEIIVLFPAGGAVDTAGRIIADAFKTRGVDAVVINRPGANGNVGIKSVSKSNPDGHRILLTSTSFVFNKVLDPIGSEYDLLQDFSHVGVIGYQNFSIFARADLPYKNYQELNLAIKAGHFVTLGTSSGGAELTAYKIKQNLGSNLTIIRYQGSAPAVVDLVGGHIDLIIDSNGSSIIQGNLSSGKVRQISNLDAGNSTGVVLQGWVGISLAPETPPQIVEYFLKTLNDFLSDKAVRERLQIANFNPANKNSSKTFTSLILSDYARYSSVASTNTR